MASFGGIELPEWVGDLGQQVTSFTSGRPQMHPEEEVLSRDTFLLRQACALHARGVEAAKEPGLNAFELIMRRRLTSLAHDYMEYELARLSGVLGRQVKIGLLRSNGAIVNRVHGEAKTAEA